MIAPGSTSPMLMGGGFIFNYVISANTLNFNLKSAAIAAGWDQIAPLIATVTINSGIAVGSSSTGAYGFDTGSTFPAGSILSLVNNGTVIGAGCAGGAGGNQLNGGAGGGGQGYNGGNGSSSGGNNGGTPGAPGGAGGTALHVQYRISIVNNGTIGGGGGGGGGAGTGGAPGGTMSGAGSATAAGAGNYYGGNGGTLGQAGNPGFSGGGAGDGAGGARA